MKNTLSLPQFYKGQSDIYRLLRAVLELGLENSLLFPGDWWHHSPPLSGWNISAI